MKLLESISYLYPAWEYGGPGKLVYELSSELVRRGHTVTVNTTDAFSGMRRRFQSDNASGKEIKFRLNVFRNISNRIAYRYKAFLAPGVLLISRQIQTFDCIHCHEFFTPMTAVIAIVSKYFDIPYVLSVHGTLDVRRLKHRGIAKTVFMNFFGNRILGNVSKCIAATEEEKSEYSLLGVPGKKISFVPNGIDVSQFAILPASGSFRKKYRISGKTKILLFVGRIHRLKGLEILIEAFNSLRRTIPDCRLVIIGNDDGYLRELQRLINRFKISDTVLFPGVLYGKEKCEVFADTDVFVYPSPTEGFSIAILEAAAAGLPLVITKGCKFPEIAAYHAGMEVDANPHSLCSALKKLISDQSLRKRMGSNAKRLIKKKYSIESMAKSLEKIYSEVQIQNV
jgi:glycosyltransferase involved in cell wall biosynthesis